MGGYKKIDPSVGNKTQFSSSNQPDPSKKGPKGPRMKTLLIQLLKKAVTFQGEEMTGEEAVLSSLINQAVKEGNVPAIKEVLDRIDGKVTQPIAQKKLDDDETLDDIEREIRELEEEERALQKAEKKKGKK